VAAGKNDLFGHTIKGSLPVLMVLAEDDKGAVKRSMNDICASLGVNLADLPITLCCKPPVDLTLAIVDDRGGWEPGLFYATLAAAMEKLGPGAVFLDTAVDFAVLNENLRAPVTKFCRNVLGALAERYKATIVLNAHPSKTGMRDGTGTSGSTAWRNAVRNMLMFERVNPDDKGDKRRTLKVGAANYGDDGRLDLEMTGAVFTVMQRQSSTVANLELMDACIKTAAGFAKNGQPIQRGRAKDPKKLNNVWALEEIRNKVQRDVSPKEVLQALAAAERSGYLRYQTALSGSHGQAGYYPDEKGFSKWAPII
jgi:AAA domain